MRIYLDKNGDTIAIYEYCPSDIVEEIKKRREDNMNYWTDDECLSYMA